MKQEIYAPMLSPPCSPDKKIQQPASKVLQSKEKQALTFSLKYPIQGILWLLRPMLRVSRKLMRKISWVISWLNFRSREDDIYIITYPRSGTTLMQMILYQLTSDGDMSFTHISEKVPYFERAVRRVGTDLNDTPGRRIFKTHMNRNSMYWWPGKYIYIVRNGPDTLASYYNFYQSHFGYTGNINQFYDAFMRGDVAFGSWFDHVAGWQKCANENNILYLKYEDLVADLESVLPKIAMFCGIDLTPPVISRTLERSSFEYMKKHEEQFDFLTELFMENKFKKGQFVRKGAVGEGKEYLSVEQVSSIEMALANIEKS